MSDTSSIRSSLRASTLNFNRPHFSPMGPRMRKSRSTFGDTQSLSSTLDLHEFGGRSLSSPIPMTPSSPSSSSFITASDHMSLPAVSEEPKIPLDSIPPPSSPSSSSFISDHMSITLPAVSEELKTTLEYAPAYEEEDSRSITEDSRSITTSYSQDSLARVSLAPAAAPKLMPPPGIKFKSTQVPWKALPLEAAMWTFDSQELQNIVARAIQSSEAFIRLLTLENVDNVLPAELERLDTLKSVTQSKYRFLIHRRTMLFHALNSSLLGAGHKSGEGASVIGGLASQLADTIAECDKLSEQLLSISDQSAQINKLIDIHLGSAFAIALRKLNGSLTRRVADLTEAKERITQLEGEVQEAWKEAEHLAKELDDYETELTAHDAEAIIEVAEIVPIQSPTHSRRPSTPMSPQLLSIPASIAVPTSPMEPHTPSGSQFVIPPPKAQLKEKESEAEDVPDTVSIRSSRSTPSTKSAKSARGEVNRTTSIMAAKRRSRRASQSNLRLTIGHIRKQSSILTESSPPVPELPLHLTNNVLPVTAGTPYASSTLLLPDPQIPSLRRQGSLDTICTLRTPATSAATVAFRGRSADDMYVRPYNSSASEVSIVPRSNVYNLTTPTKYEISISETIRPMNDATPIATTSKTIPSMWTNVDAVKSVKSELPLAPPSMSLPPRAPTPSEHSPPDPELALRHSKSMRNTYSKLKTLTKRYSTSLPFHTKSSQARKPRPRSD